MNVVLGDKVEKVVISDRVVDSLCCLVAASFFGDHTIILKHPEKEWACGVLRTLETLAALDYLVLGKGQIFAQVKQVVKVALCVFGFGRNMMRLFQHAIIDGKRARTKTNIVTGVGPVSSVVVELALMKLPKSSQATAQMLVLEQARWESW
ncbi:hypothetical protein V6N13_005927 [Hibiscus sabdariffa]